MKALPAIGVVAGLALAAFGVLPPSAHDASTPAGEFSAARAFADVEVLAAAPRPVGSAQHAAAREHLLARLRSLGAAVETQETVVDGVPVVNLLARLPGTGGDGAVLLCAHYDSVRAGPGAGDDALGCAVALEIARAVAASSPLARDLIVLLSDGEEIALLGARAFAAGGDGGAPPHRWATEVAAAFNFEARGSGGPAWAFQTGAENGALIAALARAPAPAGSSLAKAVYERMPNDTDFTVFLRAGLPGLNFACIDRFASYHTALDVTQRLDRGTLQQMGDQGLAVARYALAGDAPLRAPDAVYFNLLGRVFVHHPLSWVPALAALAAMLAAAACGRMRARLGATALGVLAALAAVALPVLAALLLARALPEAFSLAASRASDAALRATGLAVAAAAAAAAWTILGLAGRWRRLHADAGAIVITAIGAIAAAILLPEGAFLFLVPGLAAPAALLVRGAGAAASGARALAAAIQLSLAGVWTYNLILALALPGVFAPAALAALSAVQLRPLLRAAPTC